MEREHGPSNQLSETIRELFGSDSEDIDVLEISAEADDILSSPTQSPFITPNKWQRIVYVPPPITPLPDTPIHIRVNTPAKKQQRVYMLPLVSPLPKTPTVPLTPRAPTTPQAATSPSAHSEEEVQSEEEQPCERDNAREAVHTNPHTAHNTEHQLCEVDNVSSEDEQHTAHSTEYQPNNCEVHATQQLIAAEEQRFGEERNTNARTERPLESNLHVVINAQQQHAHTAAHTTTEVRTELSTTVQCTIHNNWLYEQYSHRQASKVGKRDVTLKRTFFQVQRTRKRTHTHTFTEEQEEEELTNDHRAKVFAAIKLNRQIHNTHTKGPIVERHNFEREIRVKVKNDLQRSNGEPSKQQQLQKQASQQQQIQERASQPAPKGTRVITLNYKHAPEGVQLAIAVDKNKRYSRNALKRITRNLANQMN